MRQVVIRNLNRPDTLPVQTTLADSFLTKLRGLMFRRSLPFDQGLLLVQPRDSRLDASIHMLGMFMDLAVVWINDAREVVDVCLARKWRPAYFPKQPSRFVLEMNPDRLPDFHIGDRVEIHDL